MIFWGIIKIGKDLSILLPGRCGLDLKRCANETKSVIIFWCFVLLLLISCQDEDSEQAAWDPALDQTEFEYLRTASKRIHVSQQLVREHLSEENESATEKSLAKAQETVLILLN